MKYCLLIFLLLPFTLPAQRRAPVDSLLRAADTETSDSALLIIYQQLGSYYQDNNAGKAIEFFEKENALAKHLNWPLKIGNSFYDLGYTYLLMSDFNKSLYNYQQSSVYYEQLKDDYRLSNAYMSIGNVYFQNNDFKHVDEYYDKAEYLILRMKDSGQLNSLYDSRGVNYDRAGKFDSAEIWLKRAYLIARLIKAEDYAMNSLSNLSLTYKHMNRTDEALRGFDTVLTYYLKTNAPKDYLSAIYNNIASANAQAGRIPQALEAFNKSIEIGKAAGVTAVVMENYRNMSDMFGNIRDFEKQSIYLKKYYHLKDSIFTVDNKNALTELEATYKVDKKNLELVKKDAEVSRQKNQRNIFFIIALAIFGILGALAYFYSRIKNKNALLQQQNIQINEQKNELQTLNQVKDRLFSIISHDLRNPLVTLRSYLALADNDAIAPEKKQQFKLQTMNAVSQTGDMLDNLLAWANVQIKNTKASVVPVSIPDLVEDMLSNVAAQSFQKQLSIQKDIQVNMVPGDYDILSIALRNLLTNAIKYSDEKKTINVLATRDEKNNFITVQDEGVGLTAEQINSILSNQNDTTKGTKGEKGSGLGLFLVRELLQKINATLKIESEPGKGSSFVIVLPVL
ncbi:tetratricopeptide repeat-containing sensor histidine kinase [Ferruginibacter sp. HRS2-29]|uniref:tetratricopeptide repeat-containing sensor histidine kinase n=1 Tax=Ferruginibacter sp. HRS2-29 TaxID=2487334 RepID=UPI0020CDBA83|nr:tetratricopeptide repeat-containing sensor histidine kinase [Ferruginibacter sp. HRS2-29]MCP9751862.1 GHKL domain-containing protein [Ferruginibacter sp. HRS2-29]